MAKITILLFLFTINAFLLVQAVIDEAEIKNQHGDVLIHVSDGKRVKVFNRHRSSHPTVLFSLHGSAVETIAQSSTITWGLTLEGKHNEMMNISIAENIQNKNITDYHFVWHNDDQLKQENRELCFYYGTSGSSWYAGYLSMNTSWPMDTRKQIEKQQFNYLFDQNRLGWPDTIKEHTFILEHLYLTSDGFAIVLNPNMPLFIRRTATGDDPLICLSVNRTFPYDTLTKNDSSYLDIDFHLITGENIRTVLDYVIHESGFISRPQAIPSAETLFHLPMWCAHDSFYSNSEFQFSIQFYGYPSRNIIIFNGDELSVVNNYTFSTNDQPPEQTIASLHTKESLTGYSLYEPTMRTHESTKSFCIQPCSNLVDYVDFSNPAARAFVQGELTALKYEKGFDLFYLSADSMLKNNFSKIFTLHDPLIQMTPGLLTTRYIETAASVYNTTIISEFAYRTQHLPVWVKLSAYRDIPYAQILRELIPAALSVSIAGYSFIIPFSAGRNVYSGKLSAEMYIRMIQAVTFMPGMLLTTIPHEYSDYDKLNIIVKKFFALHAEHAPLMIELAHKRVQTGSPIIRPLWYVAPEDTATYKVGDQFMVGDDILVAPVVVEGARERDIYLPEGVWLDQHGAAFTGPKLLQKVAVPLEELPYFKRQH